MLVDEEEIRKIVLRCRRRRCQKSINGDGVATNNNRSLAKLSTSVLKLALVLGIITSSRRMIDLVPVAGSLPLIPTLPLFQFNKRISGAAAVFFCHLKCVSLSITK